MQRRGAADQQGVAAAVEQPRGDVAALAVGAQEVIADVPGRPDRRHAEPEPAGGLDHHGDCLAVDDRRAVDLRGERVGVRDVFGVDGGRRGTRATITTKPAERDERGPVAAAGGARASAQGLRPTTRAAGPRRRPPRRPQPLRSRPGPVHYWTQAWSTSHVVLRTEDVVPDALRQEVDLTRVEQHGHRRLVGRSACRPSPTACWPPAGSVTPRRSAFFISSSIVLSQKPAMLMLVSLPGWNDPQPSSTFRKSDGAG